MSKRRRGLGRGLDALLGGEPSKGGSNPPPGAPGGETSGGPETSRGAEANGGPETGTGTREIEIGALEPNRYQPRNHFDEHGLEDLAESIRTQGLVQPIVVAPKEGGDGYTIIAGERRWRASKLLGLDKVPVVVREVDDERDFLELALVENIQRADLDPIEEAEAYRLLGERFELSQEEIGKRVGKGRTTITNALRLLRLPAPIQDMLRDGRLSAGQARPLLALPDAARQVELAQRAIDERLTARDLEKLATAAASDDDESEKPDKPELDANTRDAIEKLTQTLQTQVHIVRRRRGGEVRIRFGSEDELIRLYDRLMEGE